MQEYKELWNGSTLALDIGLVGGDWELGGAVWRNCFDAKGWDLGGIRGEDGEPVSTPAPESTQSPVSPDARALGSIPSVGAASAQKGDKSLAEIPLHVYTLVGYIRRELKRLEEIPDEAIVNDMEFGEWGRMDGVGSGDEVSNAPISQSEKERWSKLWNEIGSYR
ncbi:hypothetical protein M408DRAFT_30953 [Serendipita vermifera MAFF 305830]|uniref:Ubiquinol-cytochrome c chaperone domain-containing protein n=1 Tax=Serendipita vermifera MAFF 305830 TaxID=933852 RepID=A0A0C3AKD6_SERVB|nr:hypothetical protein M408DRAFT_30953 [Serendipita vermifera MAFF 305830]